MKKAIMFAALSLVLCASVLSSAATAQPQAHEIAYVASCDKGVHVYDKSADAVTCGKPAQSGTGYVIQMATDANGNAQCPKGYNYVGHVQGSGTPGGNLQYFACVKG